jgi:tetratricopeptide (TPR) repeat protein
MDINVNNVQNSNSNLSIKDLPREVNFLIFAKLEIGFLRNCILVNHEWKNMVTQCLPEILVGCGWKLQCLFRLTFSNSHKDQYDNNFQLYKDKYFPDNMKEYLIFIHRLKKSFAEQWQTLSSEDLNQLHNKKHLGDRFSEQTIKLAEMYHQIESLKTDTNKTDDEKNTELIELIKCLIRYEDFNTATHALDHLSLRDREIFKKDYLISNLIEAYLERGEFEEAEKVADKASNLERVRVDEPLIRRQKDEFFKQIVIQLRKRGRFDEATELFHRITSNSIKLETVEMISKELVNKGKIEEAYHVIINGAKDHPDKNECDQSVLLKALVDQLIIKKDFLHASEIVELIPDYSIRHLAATNVFKEKAFNALKKLF